MKIHIVSLEFQSESNTTFFVRCHKDDELNIAASFYRKEVFEAVGGFNESLVTGED